jgi:putative DNA primase/helicase
VPETAPGSSVPAPPPASTYPTDRSTPSRVAGRPGPGWPLGFTSRLVPPVLPGRLPTALADVPHWAGLRVEPRLDRFAKRPVSLTLDRWGQGARVDHPEDWADLGLVRDLVEGGALGLHGIGLLLQRDDGLVCLDLDHCLNPVTGALSPLAIDVLERLGGVAYVEATLRDGVHVFTRARLPDGVDGRRTAGIEVYAGRRFVVMTGLTLAGAGVPLGNGQEALDRLYAERFGPRVPPPAAPAAPLAPTPPPGSFPPVWRDERAADRLSDARLLALARTRGHRGHRGAFVALFDRGDWRGLGLRSPSEGDFRLALMLAFWTAGDAGRVDRLFRGSALYRSPPAPPGRAEKWDAPRGGTTYGARTVARAVAAQPARLGVVRADGPDGCDGWAGFGFAGPEEKSTVGWVG